jgi:hypothetical protein
MPLIDVHAAERFVADGQVPAGVLERERQPGSIGDRCMVLLTQSPEGGRVAGHANTGSDLSCRARSELAAQAAIGKLASERCF